MKAKFSMAAAILHGGDPLAVGHYEPSERYELSAAVRELAADTGMEVPEGWREEDEIPPHVDNWWNDPADLDHDELSRYLPR